ncbi:rRNA maturation RNase YbeY [Nafulsella turpanensis]|uniref:rRNA maturation RNase YbeY n=1 Tax=Nafulsella turpanensis TaxID=1265690 RepID=UPI000346B38C|nr:rRNA maturation RNase YbeY [Nafulsella turpanensis]
MQNIHFFSEDISFNLKKKTILRNWIKEIIKRKGAHLNEINYVFCSDAYLKQINIDYLDHHYFTDIITFDNSEEEDSIEADIFISIDRVKENSTEYSKNFEEELHRVMIHGVLHLLGYPDKTEEEQKVMRQEEDQSLSLLLPFENQ